MSTIGDRIRQEREARELSQEKLAKVAHVTKMAVSLIESNKTKDPGITKVWPICKELGLRLQYVITGRGEKYGKPDDDDSPWIAVKAFRVGVNAGQGASSDEYAEVNQLHFRHDSLLKKGLYADKLQVYYASGHSMEPTIRDGAAVLVNTDETKPRHDKLFVLDYDGHGLVKRLKKLGDTWFLVSDNRDDPKWADPVPIDMSKGFDIKGRVRWIGTWED